jgi:drug/metabolite transporter (DMT)-like permease
MAIGGLLITPVFLLSRPNFRSYTRKDLLFPILGGLFTTVDLSLWSSGIHYTTIANATLMGNTAPVWVVLASILIFKEKFKGKFWVGMIFAMAGAAIVLGYDFLVRPQFTLGDGMTLISGIFYAGYYISTQHGRKRLGVIEYLWWVSLSSSISLLGVSLVLGMPIIGYPLESYLSFIAAGVIVQGIGYVAIAYALGHLPASVASPTMIIQPLLSALLAIPLEHESFLPVQWLGTVAVLGGVYLINRSHDETGPPAPSHS